MKRFIAALLLGLAVGYHYGFDDATDGRESVFARTLDQFGASKLKKAQTERDRKVEEAGKP